MTLRRPALKVNSKNRHYIWLPERLDGHDDLSEGSPKAGLYRTLSRFKT